MTSPMSDALLSTFMSAQAGKSGGGSPALGSVLQMVEMLKGGGAKGDALKSVLQQKLQAALGGMAPNDPKRALIADVLAGKPINKDALLSANPGLFQSLQAQAPEMAALLQGSGVGTPAPAPTVSPALKEQFWGHLNKVGETADRASQSAQAASQAAQAAAQGVQSNTQQIQELRVVVNQMALEQQKVNDTLRNLPSAIAELITKPAPKTDPA